MKRLILLIAFSLVILLTSTCTSPGTLIVQIKPDKEPITFIRAFESDKPYLQMDMLSKGNGKFTSKFPYGSDVTVIVKADGRKPISKTTRFSSSEYQYIEFDISKRIPNVEFIRMKSNREINFKPINKTRKNKMIYLSYVDYIGQNLLLKKNIEDHLRNLGYNIAKTVNSRTELIATINLVDFAVEEQVEGFNKFKTHRYKFKINIEQRLSGNTKLEEKHAYFRELKDDIDYDYESFPMNGMIKGSKPEFTVDLPVIDVEKPAPSGLLVMLGLTEDEEAKKEEKGEEEPEDKKEDSKDKAKGPNADAGKGDEGSKEEKTEESAAAEQGEAAKPAYLNTRGLHAKSTLNYHLYQEEVIIEASVRLINIESQNKKASKKITELLSSRLAHIFNL